MKTFFNLQLFCNIFTALIYKDYSLVIILYMQNPSQVCSILLWLKNGISMTLKLYIQMCFYKPLLHYEIMLQVTSSFQVMDLELIEYILAYMWV